MRLTVENSSINSSPIVLVKVSAGGSRLEEIPVDPGQRGSMDLKPSEHLRVDCPTE